jgi:hypothetical protein
VVDVYWSSKRAFVAKEVNVRTTESTKLMRKRKRGVKN